MYIESGYANIQFMRGQTCNSIYAIVFNFGHYGELA
jgi:hypothetical protein